LDGDPDTDKYVNVLWLDLGGNWPNQTLPVKLFDGVFQLDSSFPEGSTTTVRFTGEPSIGYGFRGDSVIVTEGVSFCLDVDDNGQEQPLGDGILIVRYMAGFTDQPLVEDVVDPDGNRTDTGEIKDYLDEGHSSLDIDDNGQVSPLGDGILIIRYLAGFTGQPLIEDVVDPDGGRTSPEEIVTYLDSLRCSQIQTGQLDAVAWTLEENTKNDGDSRDQQLTTSNQQPTSDSLSSVLPAEPSHLPDLPGLVNAGTTLADIQGQVIYLDFDGAQDVVYNGPVTVGPFDVPAFSLEGTELAGQEDVIISEVLLGLEQTFAGSGVIFTNQQPSARASLFHRAPTLGPCKQISPGKQLYSTIYIGGDDSAFAEYGEFLGLAEQVDIGNEDKSDNAFIFTELVLLRSPLIQSDFLTRLIHHEIGHLIGYRHD